MQLPLLGLKSFSRQNTTNGDEFVHFSQRLASPPDYVVLEHLTGLALLNMAVELAEILHISHNTSDGVIWEGGCRASQATLEGVLCLQDFIETSAQ